MPKRGPHNPAISWTPHLRLSFGGSIGAPALEIWSNTVNFRAVEGTEPTSSELDAIAAGVVPALTTWFQASASRICAAASLLHVKANWIQASGLQRDVNTHFFDLSPSISGGQGDAVPWYETYALTLRTEKARGRSHSGRIFPPLVSMTGFSVNSGQATGTEIAAYAATFAHCLKQMCTAMETATAAADTWLPVVVSPGNTAKSTTPVFSTVNGVVADTIPDVQHRRTHKIRSVYSVLQPLV